MDIGQVAVGPDMLEILFYDADQEVDVVKSIQVVGGGTAGRSSQLR